MHSEDFNFSAEYESQKKKSHFQPVQNNAALNLNLTHSMWRKCPILRSIPL